jgi:transcriptional regulator with XRE-family HTH domain
MFYTVKQEMIQNPGPTEMSRKMQALELIEGALAMRGRASGEAARRPRHDGVGARLARIRRERGLSQTELAERVGVIQRVVSHYETGRTRIPTDALFKLADVLNVSVYELLGRATTPPRAPKNKKLWKVLEKIESLAPHDQKVVLRYIDAVAKDTNSRS